MNKDRCFIVPGSNDVGERMVYMEDESWETTVYYGQYNEIFKWTSYTDSGSLYEINGCRINKGDIVVDVGANIGIFARRAWEREASSIISFEPQRKAYSFFQKNMKDNMEVYNIGIASKESFFDLSISESPEDPKGYTDTGSGSIIKHADHLKRYHTERVYCTSLNNLYDIGMIKDCDFLKIDCEGAEVEVLNGISDERLSNIRCVSIELHRLLIGDDEVNNIRNRMTKLGFQMFSLYLHDHLILLNCWKKIARI